MKPKHLFYFILIAIPLLLSGCQSREKKAKAIAKKAVQQILTDASSYEPMLTQVDSAFSTIYLDPEAVRAAYALNDLNSEEEALKSEYNSEKSSAAIWSGPYMSNFGKENLRQANEKMNEISEKLKKISDKKAKQEQIIKDRNKNVDPTKFIGWFITHRFRCANGFGTKLIQDVGFLVDENMENTLMAYDLDEDSDEGIEKLKAIIDDVIEAE